MNMQQQMQELWQALSTPRTLVELAIIAALIGLAALVAGRFSQQPALGDSVQADGLRRLAFPILAVVLVLIAQFIARQYEWPVKPYAVAVQLLLAMAVIRMIVFALRQITHAPWIVSFERYIVLLIWACVALDILGVLGDLTQWLDGFVLPLGKSSVSLLDVLRGALTAIATLLAALWLGGLIEGRLLAAKGLDSSLQVVFSRLIKALLLFVALLVGMGMAGLDITALSVFGGALGVGLGFGMQKIASNYVSGFIILLDHSIRIGNIIQVGEQRGEVERITTRYTVLRGPGGVHHLVPNETIVSSVVQNDTYTDRNVRLMTQVQVSYRSDVEATLALLEGIAQAHPRVLTDPAPQALLLNFADSGITLELGFWIGDPEVGRRDVVSEINRRILQRFREQGIEIPFPQREVRMLQ